MKTNYLRGFPNEIKIIDHATTKIITHLKQSRVPLTPDNVSKIFDTQKASDAELAIAVDTYESRLGKKDELLEVKRMARETILSLFNLLKLENLEDLENILREIDQAREILTIISLFGTASFFIAEFSNSSQLKDSTDGTKKMATNVKRMMDDNKENIRIGVENKIIDEKAGLKILSSLTHSQATLEEHSMKMENLLRQKEIELSKLLARMEKTERMFDQLKKHHIQMVKRMDEITVETRTDMLTGMLNWKGFNEALDREVSQFKRYKTPLSMAMIHIDNFPKIVSEFGTPVTDKLLVELGNQLKVVTRKGDICGRVGGETIAVLFTNTELKDSVIAVNKLHKNLVDTDFTVRGNSIHVNLSVGVNQCSEEDTPETITESVDALMQKAKLTEGTHICHPD